MRAVCARHASCKAEAEEVRVLLSSEELFLHYQKDGRVPQSFGELYTMVGGELSGESGQADEEMSRADSIILIQDNSESIPNGQELQIQ